jgi:hypothetical protein
MMRIELNDKILTDERQPEERDVRGGTYALRLLHFGREPKFYRVICENRLKHHSEVVESRKSGRCRLLLGEAVQGAESPHEVHSMDADYFAIRK